MHFGAKGLGGEALLPCVSAIPFPLFLERVHTCDCQRMVPLGATTCRRERTRDACKNGVVAAIEAPPIAVKQKAGTQAGTEVHHRPLWLVITESYTAYASDDR